MREDIQDDIAAGLTRLKKHVESAERENKQGWTISLDLRKMRTLLDDLENLDRKQVDLR